ncbi:hypothetical protein [Streptomyces sp. NBC_01244]|uniref:hypothetical protein n=1 Tax=Streptomyces sp. NBC_01244 TaxID=2903797 RepID=UPI002E147727|nr:hypothetical protein OG247_41385 [Streptomyces sp. NBC_01244]
MTESFAGTYYPHLREVLDPRYAGLSDGELEEAFSEAFGESVTLAEYEEFFKGFGRTLAKAAKSVGKIASAVGPGLLQGAAAGSALGPFGALGGALLGATGSALKRYGGRGGREIGGLLGGALNTAGALTGRGALTSGLLSLAGGRGGPASSTLTALLGRPEMAQALAALRGGRNPSIPVGRGQVPVSAHTFAGLLGTLAKEAEAEWATDTESDESTDDQQAGRLLGLLVGAEQEEAEGHGSEKPGACGCAHGTAGEYEEAVGFAEFAEFEEGDETYGFGEFAEPDFDDLADHEEFAARFHDLVHAR